MDEATAKLQKRLYAAAAAVLLAGLCGAAAVYFTAGDDAGLSGAAQIVIIDGKTYSIPRGDNRAYDYQLERFGGKGLVLLDDFDHWFSGLWRGRALARTLGVLSVLLSLALYLLAARMSPGPGPDAADAGDRDQDAGSGS
jgi:hypothetical protein